MEAVDTILEQLCRFGLRRREPILAVGGGVLLDIVGMAAALYRRGVPFIRVPTTLLALVDASVGVKNGVDYCSCSMGPQKNRVGTFYAPMGAFLDKSFIATQVHKFSAGTAHCRALRLYQDLPIRTQKARYPRYWRMTCPYWRYLPSCACTHCVTRLLCLFFCVPLRTNVM